jgi:hypothetical protein
MLEVGTRVRIVALDEVMYGSEGVIVAIVGDLYLVRRSGGWPVPFRGDQLLKVDSRRADKDDGTNER